MQPLSVHSALLISLCLLLSGCYRQPAPEQEPSALPSAEVSVEPVLEGLTALILNYQAPEQRQGLQDLLTELEVSAKLKRSAGGQAEFELELNEAQALNLLNALQERYRIERRGQRLYLVCCL